MSLACDRNDLKIISGEIKLREARQGNDLFSKFSALLADHDRVGVDDHVGVDDYHVEIRKITLKASCSVPSEQKIF